MATLGVNIDHVATVREARQIDEPDPLQAAEVAEAAGCHGITVHLREDRRHIQDEDVFALRKQVKTKLNLELSVHPDILRIAQKLRPDQVTFVPEHRDEVTTEGGLNLMGSTKYRECFKPFLEEGIIVSLFVDPDLRQLDLSKDLGVQYVEIHTGAYANACKEKDVQTELERIQIAVAYAKHLGLCVNAGHGLNYHNVRAVAAIPGTEELNIGHSIVSRAIFVGLRQAVEEMLERIR